jgi:hypothetical protein
VRARGAAHGEEGEPALGDHVSAAQSRDEGERGRERAVARPSAVTISSHCVSTALNLCGRRRDIFSVRGTPPSYRAQAQ